MFDYKVIEFSRVRTVILTSLLAIFTLAQTSAVAEAPMSGRRDIYCAGVRGGVIVYARLEAICASYKPFATYRLSLQAAGSAILAGNGFRLSILYPAERYAADFDPVPGDYYASSKGFAPGVSHVKGSSGNKLIRGYVINGGAGVDWSYGLLKIERGTLDQLP